MKAHEIEILAPCKLNLHLRVLGKREDGFHDIESLFQLISVSDRLVLSLDGHSGTCDFICPQMDLPLVNTVTRAVQLFRNKTGFSEGLRVELYKTIPSGAGLGGGSSDAASVLMALDALAGTGLKREGLFDLAAKIGSDVPFFLYGGAALVRGTGDRIEPIKGRDDLYGVLIWPGVHSCTAQAYGLVDQWHSSGKDSSFLWPRIEDIETRYYKDPRIWGFSNSFTSPIEKVYPIVEEARRSLLAEGALMAGMSGSGSSVFGLFEDVKGAKHAFNNLEDRFLWVSEFLLLASRPMR